MSHPYAIAIVNPRAGGHSTYREWPLIRRHLADKGLLFDCAYTEGEGHAIELATEAAKKGYRCIIAVGGDGTVNEVVNGILNSGGTQNITLGIVSAGTTCSFARSLGIPRDRINSCNLLDSPNRLRIDVGIVGYTKEGQRRHRFFANEADVGLGAIVVEASRHFTNYLGRKINYLPHVVGGVASLVSYKNKGITLRLEGKVERVDNCAMLVIANGAHFGGEMQMAPDARPNDGLLDMVIFGDMGKSELLKILPLTYKGRHLSHHKVRMLKIREVEVECDESILVEADGELLGEGPVSFSVVPSAIDVIV